MDGVEVLREAPYADGGHQDGAGQLEAPLDREGPVVLCHDAPQIKLRTPTIVQSVDWNGSALKPSAMLISLVATGPTAPDELIGGAVTRARYRVADRSFASFCHSTRQFCEGAADNREVTSVSSPVQNVDPRIAEALRLPPNQTRARFSDVRDRRARRKIGTAVFDRFRIALPWDDHVGLA